MSRFLIRTFNISNQEKNRFGRFILPENKCQEFFYESIKSWVTPSLLKKTDITFLWGARPPDLEALKYSLKFSKKIFILQHAKNPIRKKHT